MISHSGSKIFSASAKTDAPPTIKIQSISNHLSKVLKSAADLLSSSQVAEFGHHSVDVGGSKTATAAQDQALPKKVCFNKPKRQ